MGEEILSISRSKDGRYPLPDLKALLLSDHSLRAWGNKWMCQSSCDKVPWLRSCHKVPNPHTYSNLWGWITTTRLLTRGIQGLFRQEPEIEQKSIPGVEFGKETVAKHAGGQNRFHVMVRKPDSGVLRMLGLCSGCSSYTPVCSPSAQVKQQLLTSAD
jgi:hypothetical protein